MLTKKELRRILDMETEPLAQLATDIVLELADRAKEAEDSTEEEGKEE